MNRFRFGFLGCGNMGGALAQASAKALSKEELAVCDFDAGKTKQFADRKLATVTDAKTIAKCSDYIFVAVKPQGVTALFGEISPVLKERKDRFVIVSMAAGVSIADLERAVGVSCPIIRMMPNTPVSVGEGMILYTSNPSANEQDVEGYLKGLSHAGKFDRIPESLIDAAGSLSGCGPAYAYLFAEALADGAVYCGVPRKQANLYAAQMLLGSAKLLLESGRHPGELKDAVCSPGGTTIAGVETLEAGSFRGTVMNSVIAAFEKTAKLKK